MAAPASERTGWAADAAAHGGASAEKWDTVAALAVWAPLLWRISPAWSASVEQAHGWAVPVLAGYCWWERRGRGGDRQGHPLYDNGSAGRGMGGWAAGRVGGATALLALLLAAGALVLATTVLAANPLWPAAQWGGYAAATGLTALLLAARGGAAAVRRCWFPIFFLSTALTWPTALTMQLQAALVGMNTQIAAALVSTAGHPAVVSGNVIEVATGFVGLDEACSGVRSLQAAWMAAWFFGELGALAAARRAVLVAGALAAAVGGNLIRTTTLTWLAAARDPGASAAAHDLAGTLEMIGVLATVAALAGWLGRGARGGKGGLRPRSAAPGIGELDRGGDAERREVRERRPALAGAADLASGTRGRSWAYATIAVGLLAAAVPAAWYGWHEARLPGGRIQWQLQRPDERWQAVAWPEATLELLRASATEGWELPERGGEASATALLVRWEGDVTAAVFAELHGPTVCLPAAGAAVAVSERPETVTVAGVPIRFEVGSFAAEGRARHVFFCQWDAWLGRARAPTGQSLVEVSAWRWQRVVEGRRHGDAAYLVFVVAEADEAAARAWLESWAPRLLERK